MHQAAYEYSRRALWLGLAIVTIQLLGFYALIYQIYSWDEMEPYTYLLGKPIVIPFLGVFYSLVGILFYKLYRGDLELQNVRQILASARFAKLSRSGPTFHKEELAR